MTLERSGGNQVVPSRIVRGTLLAAALSLTVVLGDDAANAQNTRPSESPGLASEIATTDHPPLPTEASRYWLVPESSVGLAASRQAEPGTRFARGVALVGEGKFEEALPLLREPRLTGTPLESYARYFAGVALLGLARPAEASAALSQVPDRVQGYLRQAAPLRLAEAALAGGNAARAADILDDLADAALLGREDVLLRLGAALEADGRAERAASAYARLYYDFPLSEQSAVAQAGLERLQTPALASPPDRFQRELARAERLFDGRRWAQARAGFVSIQPVARAGDRERIALRLGECDFQLGRHRAAQTALLNLGRGGPLEAEARFHHLSATRGLGEFTSYAALVRGLVADHPDSRWAEEALNNFASHLVTRDDEDAADQVFRELARRFPRGRFSDRAAWRIGWRAYKLDRFEEAARTFEGAAAVFPRSDYRPSWLYWAARSHDQRGSRTEGTALYRVAAADYLNSYYGRRAAAALTSRGAGPVQPIVATARVPPGPLVPTDALIRTLVSLELYDTALNEVEYARLAWGDSPALQASVAGIRHRRALKPGAADRFADLRGAITIMRRTYPQFMAAGGEQLPSEVLRVIFPLDYWPLITKYSDAHGLDRYLMTALIAQESTFTADVRSSANAVGLMQLIPATGRRVARQLGIRYTPTVLTQAETNIRLGMRYFKDLTVQFGAVSYALAGYNAGEGRVVRWKAERPGFDEDEFIDDIPFAETQAYVKRIIGTADDYRRLYAGGVLSTGPAVR